jgi:hypothetical protein
MKLPNATYVGPAADDHALLDELPRGLREFLSSANGIVAYRGGLHVRGACVAPAWHSLRHAWHGDNAFHRSYEQVLVGDIPFAEDAVGDQWLLRDGLVVRLRAETGEVEPLGLDWVEFWEAVDADPVETLGLHPLLQYEHEGSYLEPGQLLSVYPPFCMEEARNGVSLRAISTHDRLAFLAELAAVISAVPDGAEVKFDFVD